ncbi:hypothetical protein RHMOL_Rhmol01G0103500 [Rhododendron molle]|uniref:Uncharacterized protein n=1 Tax=Rhododendron molle TaxID=49168 RepID=A0ACC0PZV2_RHOML|nr:hypothetical protein RHMOL_Rhmol01G0103500 [Rhododendron molle]
MENFAQDPLAIRISGNVAIISGNVAIRISGNELPFPNPRNPFAQAGASGQLEESCRFFPLSTILKATNDFDDALVVGTGGFGKVYKAIIDDGTVVAIKRLNAESNQGAEEFWTEVKLLSKIRHAHLVSLVGYCNEHQEMILVYEYMAHGTLASHLYKSSRDESGESVSPLKWAQRLNICLGAAQGLNYLHTGTKQPIIHRDVKTTNILLDKNWVAKVSDFGICKLITSQTTTHVSTKVKATRGYWDPDYIYTNRVTRKSDVYAFGVVLLEVLCGRPPLDHGLEEEQISLILWAKDHIGNGKLDRIIDPSLNGELTPQSLKHFSKLANNCLHTKPKERPTMSEVVEILQNALALHERKGRSRGMNRWWREGNGNGSNDGGGLPKLGDLYQCLKEKGALSPSTAINFALDIARGMAYLHNEPNVVVHGDLKPRNVLLVNSSADHLKVGDFDLSKLIRVQNSHDLYKMTGETESYRYMAPEVFKHQRYDTKVDVFSFAMILCEMLEGDPPMSHYEPYEVAKYVAAGHRPMFRAKGYTPQLKELTEECWAEDMNLRPSFLEIFKRLEKIKEGK